MVHLQQDLNLQPSDHESYILLLMLLWALHQNLLVGLLFWGFYVALAIFQPYCNLEAGDNYTRSKDFTDDSKPL